jgi:hypothetical protein
MKDNLAVHMRCHLFLHYDWFLQNLGKDSIPSIMHTTVLINYSEGKEITEISIETCSLDHGNIFGILFRF